MPQLKILYATTKRSHVSQPRPDAAKSISMLFKEREREDRTTQDGRKSPNWKFWKSIAQHGFPKLSTQQRGKTVSPDEVTEQLEGSCFQYQWWHPSIGHPNLMTSSWISSTIQNLLQYDGYCLGQSVQTQPTKTASCSLRSSEGSFT